MYLYGTLTGQTFKKKKMVHEMHVCNNTHHHTVLFGFKNDFYMFICQHVNWAMLVHSSLFCFLHCHKWVTKNAKCKFCLLYCLYCLYSANCSNITYFVLYNVLLLHLFFFWINSVQTSCDSCCTFPAIVIQLLDGLFRGGRNVTRLEAHCRLNRAAYEMPWRKHS